MKFAVIAVIAGKGVQRVIDYLLQQHNKLFEPYRKIGKVYCSTACKFVKSYAVLFGNLLKRIK
jgi:hypothetical protein